MKLRTLKLGVVCYDKATGLDGMLTHWICNMNREVIYWFQPKMLNPDNGKPVSRIFLEEARIPAPECMFEEVEIPFEILGTTITDLASGFSGMAVNFVRHINGCFHVTIQPPGFVEKTKCPVEKLDFDLRQCTGEMIQKMTEKQLADSKEKTPSPYGDGFPEPAFVSGINISDEQHRLR